MFSYESIQLQKRYWKSYKKDIENIWLIFCIYHKF